MLKESQVYKYWDIVYSCFVPHEMLSEHRMPVHVLIYVYSGEMQVDDGGRTLTVGEGNYVFQKRDHQVKLLKHTAGDAPYKAISIRFERGFLRDFFSRLDKTKLPVDVKRIREAAVLLPKTPALQSLFLSLFPYTDANVKPKDEIIQLKMQEALYCLLDTDARFYPTLFDFNESWKIDLLPFMEANYTQDMTLEEFATYTGRSLATFKRDFAKVATSRLRNGSSRRDSIRHTNCWRMAVRNLPMYMWRWASRTVRTSPVRSSGNSGCRREGWQLHVRIADVEPCRHLIETATERFFQYAKDRERDSLRIRIRVSAVFLPDVQEACGDDTGEISGTGVIL